MTTDDEPIHDQGETVWSLLDAIEERLDEIIVRLDELRTDLATVINHVRANRL